MREEDELIRDDKNTQTGIQVILSLAAIFLLIFGCITSATTSTPIADYTSTVQPISTPTSQSTETATPAPVPVTGEALRVYFFDVGQGDATLLLEPNGKTVLIDGGEANTGIVQDRLSSRYFKNRSDDRDTPSLGPYRRISTSLEYHAGV